MVSANRFKSSSISLPRDSICGPRSRTSIINATSNRPAEIYSFTKPVSSAFVHRQLRLLKTSKGTGLDGIPARLLKDVAPSISAPLTAIIDLSISSAVLPEEWKYARVVPLYKDGDKKCMDNYRPISVLPVASKILERAVQIQLLQHLDTSSQLSPFQCGFRKNHSTQDAVTYFTDCIRKGIDEGCFTAAVFVDFRKAFDSVNHQLASTSPRRNCLGMVSTTMN